MMEWLFWTIILSTSLYGLDKLYSPGSLWGCNSNKASLITKWQYYGEIRNLRNTNLGVLLLSSRALVIAINWDGPSPPSPLLPPPLSHLSQSPDLGNKSQLWQTWLSFTVVVFSWQDSSYNCWHWLFILIALRCERQHRQQTFNIKLAGLVR